MIITLIDKCFFKEYYLFTHYNCVFYFQIKEYLTVKTKKTVY